MEQLVIFLLFVVASIVSGIIQKKKKAAEEAAQRELEQSVGPRPAQTPASQSTTQPPVTRWPRTVQDWQEQLRKMVEENAPPVIKPVTKPVVIKPVIVSQQRSSKPAPTSPIVAKILPPIEKSEGDLEFKSPLRESASAYERASSLQAKVEQRFRAVDQQTSTHRPTPVTRSTRHTHQFIRNLRKRPSALREAFVASLIFSPPKAMETSNVSGKWTT
jgi:hypothetical protein